MKKKEKTKQKQSQRQSVIVNIKTEAPRQSREPSTKSKEQENFFANPQKETLGIIESYGLVANLRAADAALKESDIQALELSLSTHLGGKGFFAFCGKLESVEAALQKAVLQAPKAMIMHQQCIARPDAHLYWQIGSQG